MSASLTSLAYLIAAVLFILALRGLSSPVTSRQGNRFGMIGMGVAVAATLLHHGMSGWGYGLIVLGIAIGVVLAPDVPIPPAIDPMSMTGLLILLQQLLIGLDYTACGRI